VTAVAARGEASIRAGLVAGPLVACIGIAWTAIAPSTASSAAVLVGLVTCFLATHRFGRLGADEGPVEPSHADATDEQERVRRGREEARAQEKKATGRDEPRD
jgi:hypothetical protein